MARVEIIVLNWNGLEDTLECVDSVLQSSLSSFLLHVIDNGSDGHDLAALESRFGDEPRVRVAGNDENLGFTRGMNRAVEEVLATRDPEFIVLLNNDAVVAPDWLEKLVEAAGDSRAAIVASRMVNYYDPETLDNAGHVWLNTGEILPRGAGQPAARFDEPADLVGACAGAALYRSSLLRKIGLFDGYFHTGYEDAEHGLRALLAGCATRYCPDAVVRHKISRSIDKVRDAGYAIDIQRNINYTWIKLTPPLLLAANLPFILLKTFAVPLTALAFLRFRLFRAHLVALCRTGRDLPRALAARRAFAPQRTMGSLEAARWQVFFLRTYLGYFRRFMLTGKPTVFEK